MGKNKKYVDMYEGNWRKDDLAAQDEFEASQEDGMEGMHIVNMDDWSEMEKRELVRHYELLIEEEYTHEEALKTLESAYSISAEQLESIIYEEKLE